MLVTDTKSEIIDTADLAVLKNVDGLINFIWATSSGDNSCNGVKTDQNEFLNRPRRISTRWITLVIERSD